MVATLISIGSYRHTLAKDRAHQHIQVMEWLEAARDSLSGRDNSPLIPRLTRDPASLEQAHRKIERARALEPNNPHVHLYDGMYREAIGDWSAATDACQRAKELSGERSWPPAVVCLGNVLIEQGRLDEAERTLQEAAADLQPASAVVYANLCLVRSKQGKLEEAGDACDKAVTADRRSLAAQNNFGIVLLQQGNIEGAIKRFEAALEVDAESPETLANLGLAQLYGGNHAQALRTLEKALALDPDSGLVREKLAALYREKGDELRATVLETGAAREVSIQ